MEEVADERTPLIVTASEAVAKSSIWKTQEFRLIATGYAFLFMTVLLGSLPMAYLTIDLKDNKEVSVTSASIIFSIFTYAYLLSCVVSPKLDDLIDPQHVLVVSGAIFLLVQISFSYIQYTPKKFFLPVAILLRAINGLTAGIYENIFSAHVIRTYKEHIGSMVSVAEAVINTGFLIGPLAGGFLYKSTGSLCETQQFGIAPAVFIFALFSFSAVRPIPGKDGTQADPGDVNDNNPSFLKVLKSWKLLYVLSQTFWLTTFECLPISILASYLQPIYVNYSPTFLAGIILSAKGVAYTMGSIPTGYLTDKPKFARTTFIFYVLSPLLAAIGLIISGLQAFITIMEPSLVRLIAPSFW